MPMVRATVTLAEPAHYMGPDGEILFTIHPNPDGKGVTIDFDHEPATVKIGGRTFTNPMSLEINPP